MSRLVARILLSIFVLPFGVMVYALSAACAAEMFKPGSYRAGEAMMFGTADMLTWAAMAVYWGLLWRSSVRWTRGRVYGTIGAVFGAMFVGAAISAVIGAAFGDSGDMTDFVFFLGGILAVLLWLTATIFLWRETTAERRARISAAGGYAVACPTCGYNLTGLTESRCPECGSKFTLDELLASQPARADIAEL